MDSTTQVSFKNFFLQDVSWELLKLNDYYLAHKAFYILRLVGYFYWYPATLILMLQKFQMDYQNFTSWEFLTIKSKNK